MKTMNQKPKPTRRAKPSPSTAPASNTRTLSGMIAEMRQTRKLSQRELGRLAGIDQSLVNKVEGGGNTTRGRVRAETLAAILRGLGLREGDADYARAFALWTAEHHERAGRAGVMNGEMIEARFDAATASRDAEHERLRRACEEALDALPPEMWPDMLGVLRNHRALRLWLESANALTKQL